MIGTFIRLRLIPLLEFLSYSPSKHAAHGELWRLRERGSPEEKRGRDIEAALFSILLETRTLRPDLEAAAWSAIRCVRWNKESPRR